MTKGTSATLFDVPLSAITLFRKPDFKPTESTNVVREELADQLHFTSAVTEAHEQFSRLGEWTRESIHDVIAKLPKILF